MELYYAFILTCPKYIFLGYPMEGAKAMGGKDKVDEQCPYLQRDEG